MALNRPKQDRAQPGVISLVSVLSETERANSLKQGSSVIIISHQLLSPPPFRGYVIQPCADYAAFPKANVF